MNVMNCPEVQLQTLKDWITASRHKMKEDEWVLVIESIDNTYTYYYVAPKHHTIAWIEPLDGYMLFRECATVNHWNHKSMLPFHTLFFLLELDCAGLKLEAEFW